MTDPKVVVLDHGYGNVLSVAHALERAGAQVSLSVDAAEVAQADGLVVPGVGAFAAVMRSLQASWAPLMIERRLAGGRPVLGICVGLQVMFTSGDENGEVTAGLDQWPGMVTALPAARLPHMGWSKVHVPAQSQLLAGLDGERFYFVHSYACLSDPAEALGMDEESRRLFRPPLVSWAHYGTDFVAAVENRALCATQFHPEKSGPAGARVFSNWLEML
nr:imidazole glycerol phosphate synthase subunit HisH [Mobiluncus sp. Marseille-Q7826]